MNKPSLALMTFAVHSAAMNNIPLPVPAPPDKPWQRLGKRKKGSRPTRKRGRGKH